MTTVVPISRTYISSDLFSPSQKQRVTIPTIGVQEIKLPPVGGKTWEENITTYGGIGALPFVGKVKTKDLLVSRSHRHFGSAFATYRADIQPQNLTSLKKSSCRLNDQLLPAVFKTVIDHKSCKQDPILDNNAYVTHKPKFEVFPRHKPLRTDSKSGMFELCETTRQALSDYHEKVYAIPRYAQIFTDHSDVIKKKLIPKSTKPVRYIMKSLQPETDPKPDKPTAEKLPNVTNQKKTVRFSDDFKEGPCWPPSKSYEIGLRYRLCEHDGKFALKTDSKCTRPSCVICRRKDAVESRRKLDEQESIKKQEVLEKRRVAEQCVAEQREYFCKQCQGGDHQCWSLQLHRVNQPPFNLYQLTDGVVCTCKLCKEIHEDYVNSRRIFNTEPLHYDPEPAFKQDVIVSTKPLPTSATSPTVGNIEAKFEDSTIEKSLPFLDVEHLKCPRVPFPENPLYANQTGPTYLPPISLADCVSDPNDRIPLKLGLRYKTEAYKRFHAMYPDNAPDLREPKVNRKRYFFYGYHTSAFRG